MITFDELNKQNHEITELSNVLLYLFSNRSMCDTKTANQLFFWYVEKLEQHLGAVDQLYTLLLRDPTPQSNNVVNNFMSGEQELKKIVAAYVKGWTNKKKRELVIGNYDKFMAETENLFEMVLNRIQSETERLYPLARRTSAAQEKAA